MGKFWYKMEYKFGKYALRNLPLVLIICYGVGYLLQLSGGAGGWMQWLSLNPYLILHGQIWRLFSWILIPPESFSLFTLIMLYFYYSIGKSLENVWGPFRFNVYVFSGILFTIIGSFVLYGIELVQYKELIDLYGAETFFTEFAYITVKGEQILFPAVLFSGISTYYINLALLLAFAATFPNVQVLLMYVIPIKIKYLGIVYAALVGYEFVMGTLATRVIIVASLLNFIIFFFTTRSYARVSPGELKRKHEFQKKMRAARQTGNTSTYQGRTVITRHKCAICGRTEIDDENLEFRFCSKCDGNYEYCMDHLYTHEHVRRIVPGETTRDERD